MIPSLVLAAALAAHPLGNLSVNTLVELTLRPDRVDAVAVVDLAEPPGSCCYACAIGGPGSAG